LGGRYLGSYESLGQNELLELFQSNKSLIFNNWSSLVVGNIKIQDQNEFNALIKLFGDILENFISYFKDGDMESYEECMIKIAEEMAYNEVPYNIFIMAIPYFQESYIHVLIKNLEVKDIDKCLTLSNRIYNKTLDVIRDEYFSIKDPTLTAILKLSELRDDVTGKHLQRTKDYATLLSKELNLDDNFIKNIKKASLLHDIGKIGIRDEILLKTGKFTNEEFEEMKKHTVIGAKTIGMVISANNLMYEYLYMAMDIALCHHEKYDGSGYPNGFVGEQIPLAARVFAVVDAYDVILSKRPYKKPLSHEEAVSIITADSNKHFDPNIVDVFVRAESKFKEVSSKYKFIL
jgi:HD-GYP domain-containing protein (c-di-GMP phosphodiesterase class II)